MVNDEFETLAQRFYEDTGIMAPGKNVHPAMGGGFLVSQEYRWARWTEWLRSRAESRESKHREVEMKPIEFKIIAAIICFAMFQVYLLALFAS